MALNTDELHDIAEDWDSYFEEAKNTDNQDLFLKLFEVACYEHKVENLNKILPFLSDIKQVKAIFYKQIEKDNRPIEIAGALLDSLLVLYLKLKDDKQTKKD
ncbi:MAG: hypothetical protein JSR17_04470 [Proteobacteria bacterium]|nr:hypothetical protein [Pseudomonadota bacterium]